MKKFSPERLYNLYVKEPHQLDSFEYPVTLMLIEEVEGYDQCLAMLIERLESKTIQKNARDQKLLMYAIGGFVSLILIFLFNDLIVPVLCTLVISMAVLLCIHISSLNKDNMMFRELVSQCKNPNFSVKTVKNNLSSIKFSFEDRDIEDCKALLYHRARIFRTRREILTAHGKFYKQMFDFCLKCFEECNYESYLEVSIFEKYHGKIGNHSMLHCFYLEKFQEAIRLQEILFDQYWTSELVPVKEEIVSKANDNSVKLFKYFSKLSEIHESALVLLYECEKVAAG